MNFFTVRDLRTIPKTIWENLTQSGEVIITNNGKPTALMLSITSENFDEIIRATHQAKAMIAVNSMRKKAHENGYLTEEEIATEINLYRAEKKL